MKDIRILLAEFVNFDMHPGQCGLSFPFIKGFLKAASLPVSWIRFGIRAGNQFANEENGISLDDEDLLSFDRFCQDFQPTHILFSEKPSEKLVSCLNKKYPEIKYNSADNDETVNSFNVPVLKKWLEIKNDRTKADTSKQDNYIPDYKWEAGNKLALLKTPIINILAGSECRYRKPLKQNPYYKDIDWEKVRKKYGCSFCNDTAGKPLIENYASLAASAIEQLKASIASAPLPSDNRKYQYIIHGASIFSNIFDFVKEISGTGLHGCDFLFNCRADDIIRNSEDIEKSLHEMKKSGNTFSIYLIGIENFSQAELDRMNKGINVTDLLKCIMFLRGWEKEFQDTFFFSKYGGFSTILFTPWTTLSDLEFNLKMVLHFKLQSVCGKFFYSRLRLYPGLPITLLAEKENLLIDKYSDPVLDTAKRTLYPQEVPWKFKEPVIEAVNRIVTRLKRDDALQNDNLYIRIQDMISSLPAADRDPYALFSSIIQAVKTDKEINTVDRILEHISGAAGEKNHFPKIPSGERTAANLDYLKTKSGLMLKLCRNGLKPVWKIENLSRKQVDQLLQQTDIKQFDYNRVRENTLIKNTPDRFELYLGMEKTNVDEIIRHTDIIDFSRDQAEIRESIIQAGVLLGYPECCSESFADEKIQSRDKDCLLVLSRRVNSPGEISEDFNPYGKIIQSFERYLPCSLKCRKSLDLFAEYKKIFADGPKQHSNPFIYLLDDLCFAELIPETAAGNSFRYRTGVSSKPVGRLKSVLRGDSISIEAGRISVFSKSKLTDFFNLEAAIWWHKKSFDNEFWAIWLKEALSESELHDAAPVKNIRALPVINKLNEILNTCDSLFCGYMIIHINIETEDTVRLELGKDADRIILYIKPKEQNEENYLALSRFEIQYDNATPVKTKDRYSALKALSRYLDLKMVNFRDDPD